MSLFKRKSKTEDKQKSQAANNSKAIKAPDNLPEVIELNKEAQLEIKAIENRKRDIANEANMMIQGLEGQKSGIISGILFAHGVTRQEDKTYTLDPSGSCILIQDKRKPETKPEAKAPEFPKTTQQPGKDIDKEIEEIESQINRQ